MKNFWKNYGTKSLEDSLIEAIHYKHDWCFSFKKIPSQDFVRRFKEQFSTNFMALEMQETGGYDRYQRAVDSGDDESKPYSNLY